MEIPDQLQTLFSANIEEQTDSFVVEVPEQEIRLGEIAEGQTYRVALFPSASGDEATSTETETHPQQARQTPPVQEGDQRTVEIDDIGQQGDGLTRVERGFVVIVPDTEQGERVTIEITTVRENVAFAEVVERVS